MKRRRKTLSCLFGGVCVALFILLFTDVGYLIGGEKFLSCRLQFFAKIFANATVREENWFYDVGGPVANSILLEYSNGNVLWVDNVWPSTFFFSKHLSVNAINDYYVNVKKDGYLGMTDRQGHQTYSTNRSDTLGVGFRDERLLPTPFIAYSLIGLGRRRASLYEIVKSLPTSSNCLVVTSDVGVVYRVSTDPRDTTAWCSQD